MPFELDIDLLKSRVAKLGDDELLKIAFTNANEYQPVAIEIAREELSKRGIEVEVVVTDPAGTRLLPTEPEYKGVRGWLLLFCLSLTVAFSIYAGAGLWGIRPGAVQMAKRFLLCFLGYHAVATILPFMAGLPSATADGMIMPIAQDTLRGVISFAVWYSYLNNSKRVKATFGL